MTCRTVNQVAADKWARDFSQSEKWGECATSSDVKTAALCVIVLTPSIRDWLAENDPMALRQAQLALNGKSLCDFIFETRETLPAFLDK